MPTDKITKRTSPAYRAQLKDEAWQAWAAYNLYVGMLRLSKIEDMASALQTLLEEGNETKNNK